MVRAAVAIAGGREVVLDAQFAISLTPTLEEVLNKGVPLYFLLDALVRHFEAKGQLPKVVVWEIPERAIEPPLKPSELDWMKTLGK